MDWEAKLPPQLEIKPKGNSITQEYYSKRLLPHYCEAIQSLRAKFPLVDLVKFLLLEDGDLSHGMKSDGVARQVKRRYNVENLVHPAQSPDLNPIEGV